MRDTVELTALTSDPAKTRVLNKHALRRNPDVPCSRCKLDGDELNLARVLVNGQGTSFRMEAASWCWKTCPRRRRLSSWRSSPPAPVERTPS
jgi:aminopeptidase N